MTTVPTYAHRCNRLSLDATCRTTSTLGSLSAFFGVMQPDNLMARHHFQKSERHFEARATRKSVGVYLAQRNWWTRNGQDTGDNRRAKHLQLKLKHHNCIVCRTFFVLLQKVLWRYCWSKYGVKALFLFHNCTTEMENPDNQYRLYKKRWSKSLKYTK